MKRLLAYLIVVISLGLTFSVNAETKDKKLLKNVKTDLKSLERAIYGHGKITFEDADLQIKYIENFLKIINKNIKNFNSKEKESIDFLNNDLKVAKRLIYDGKTLKSSKTQIAKAEPSQTQKVVGKEGDLIFCVKEDKKFKPKNATNTRYSKYKITRIDNPYISCLKKDLVIDRNYHDTEFYEYLSSKVALTQSYGINDLKKPITIQIAKAEPALIPKKKASKTKVDDDIIYSSGQNIFSQETSNSDGCWVATENAKLAAIRKLINKKGINSKGVIANVLAMDILNETITKASSSGEQNNKCVVNIAAKIKVEEKQTKVAKVDDSTQEEFKPKKTNQDNEAPVIEIAEAITVDSQAYTLKGKVKDKSQIYLTINGRQVDVKKGKFELDRFSIDPDVAEELKIVAIDQWNNKSEKTIKVTIDLQSADIAKVYEELKPNNVKVRTDNNKIAIIIGIEKYENLTNLDAKYANRDAKAFRTYATRALGIKPSNIKVLIDDKANRGNTLEAFKIWLPKIAGKGGKDIHIFFAGHGLASDNGKDLYILPQDGNAKLLDDTAITRVELISLIQKVNPKSVTMFFDTCYSGQTRDERMLVASLLRPIQIISEEQDTPDNFTIFSASDYDQVSGGIEEAKHGMFSYYLMKGLEGYADENKDKKITNGELIAYLKDNVSKEAFTQNREQDPMLVGDSNKVLMSYR